MEHTLGHIALRRPVVGRWVTQGSSWRERSAPGDTSALQADPDIHFHLISPVAPELLG